MTSNKVEINATVNMESHSPVADDEEEDMACRTIFCFFCFSPVFAVVVLVCVVGCLSRNVGWMNASKYRPTKTKVIAKEKKPKAGMKIPTPGKKIDANEGDDDDLFGWVR